MKSSIECIDENGKECRLNVGDVIEVDGIGLVKVEAITDDDTIETKMVSLEQKIREAVNVHYSCNGKYRCRNFDFCIFGVGKNNAFNYMECPADEFAEGYRAAVLSLGVKTFKTESGGIVLMKRYCRQSGEFFYKICTQ